VLSKSMLYPFPKEELGLLKKIKKDKKPITINRETKATIFCLRDSPCINDVIWFKNSFISI